MTAEQQANLAWTKFLRDINVPEIEHALKHVVYTAIMAERERCAKIAESFIPSGFTGTFGVARDDRARTIAHAIRNQQEQDDARHG